MAALTDACSLACSNAFSNRIASQMEALNSMAAFCENESDCRRALMLSHFGEV